MKVSTFQKGLQFQVVVKTKARQASNSGPSKSLLCIKRAGSAWTNWLTVDKDWETRHFLISKKAIFRARTTVSVRFTQQLSNQSICTRKESNVAWWLRRLPKRKCRNLIVSVVGSLSTAAYATRTQLMSRPPETQRITSTAMWWPKLQIKLTIAHKAPWIIAACPLKLTFCPPMID